MTNRESKLPLEIHCFFSNIFGMLLLIYAGVSCVLLFYRLLSGECSNYAATMRTLSWLLYIFFMGFVLLGVSQFLRDVSGQTDNKGWILRRGELIIYLAIIAMIAQTIWGFVTVGGFCSGGGCSSAVGTQQYSLSIIFSATLVFVRVLILFGIARSLRAMGYSSPKKSGDSGGVGE